MRSATLKVARFEIMRQLKKPAFWAATLLIPLLIGGIYLISFMWGREMDYLAEKTKLDELINILNGESVYVQTHNYPDQDALASAYGLKYLLEAKGIKATICYKGQIDKLNTIAMMEDLAIDTVHIDEETQSRQD